MISLSDMHHAARAAAFRCRSRWLPVDERVELAIEGVAIAIAEGVAEFGDLVIAGARAIDDEAADQGRHHGVSNAHAFGRYWFDRTGPRAPRADATLQATAVAQVFAALVDADQEALLALAAHRSIPAMAGALGIHVDTARRRVARARHAFYALWFEGVTPPSPPTDGRPRLSRQRTHCKHGHEFTPDNTYRNGRSGHKSCRTCVLARGRDRLWNNDKEAP